jgi:hypothetical protein
MFNLKLNFTITESQDPIFILRTIKTVLKMHFLYKYIVFYFVHGIWNSKLHPVGPKKITQSRQLDLTLVIASQFCVQPHFRLLKYKFLFM